MGVAVGMGGVGRGASASAGRIEAPPVTLRYSTAADIGHGG